MTAVFGWAVANKRFLAFGEDIYNEKKWLEQ
ncbi:hypothetical protein RB2150_00829 [Rhodobacterales bacterium HTCC2150]|nr:hypothetical protein RB2150_00829 [Rhodobacterales bacterium HTCC2150] [Rhodobacteraceae bacterium HTCC2150]